MVEIVNGREIKGVEEPKRQRVVFLAFSVFLRLLGLIVLGVGILFWSRVVGFQGDDIQKVFVTNEFQGVLLAVLAVVTPLLGVGLWLGMSWALILWGLLGGGLLVLDYGWQPIGPELLIFATALIFLLILYCAAQLTNVLMLNRQKNNK